MASRSESETSPLLNFLCTPSNFILGLLISLRLLREPVLEPVEERPSAEEYYRGHYGRVAEGGKVKDLPLQEHVPVRVEYRRHRVQVQYRLHRRVVHLHGVDHRRREHPQGYDHAVYVPHVPEKEVAHRKEEAHARCEEHLDEEHHNYEGDGPCQGYG